MVVGQDWGDVSWFVREGGKTTSSSVTNRTLISLASSSLPSNPSKPVIGSVVLRHLDLKLPSGDVSHRLKGIVDLHKSMEERFSAYLASERGRYLVTRFCEDYPTVHLTEGKMLDLVVWQFRPAT
jgi:hypothetical protein